MRWWAAAAVVLLTAHRALEALVLTHQELELKAVIDRKWGEMAYQGLWLDPLKDDLESFIGATQKSNFHKAIITGSGNLWV